MAPLSNHVSITITQDSVGLRLPGFGTALLLSGTAAWVGDRIRTYSSLADVAVDFAVTTSAEYRFAERYFGQNPCPEFLKIGKSNLPATKKFTLTPVVTNSKLYSVRCFGKGVTETTATYTSDSSATLAEICAGLVTAINAVVGKNFTATGGVTEVTVTGNAAGDWFGLEVTPTDIAIVEDHVDPGVATDLAQIDVIDSDWYALCTVYNSDAYVKAAAAWINAQKKIYLADTNESEAVTDASDGTQGTLDDLMTLNYSRVSGWYHPAPDAMIAGAVASQILCQEPGSITAKFRELEGVATVNLTSTQRLNLTTRNANSYENVAGQGVTFNGTTVDGDFVDVRRDLDWVESDMTARVFSALAGALKVPFTNKGVALIEAQVRATLREAVRRGIFTDDPAPAVTVPRVADVSSANKTARTLPDVKFSATLAGAIHKVTISGVVSV